MTQRKRPAGKSRSVSGRSEGPETSHLCRRMSRILAALEQARPTPRVELDHESPVELLMATILSAQCTDQRVNEVTPALFRRYRSAADFAAAKPAELETVVKSTGFYKNKTKNLIKCGQALVDRFAGSVPQTMEELVTLPGVGRKTANVLLGHCFNQPSVVVDTHVKRVANRLGFTASDDPGRIEVDLQAVIPPAQWTGGAQRLLLHGRYVCLARRPKCQECLIYPDCPWKGKALR
ncbi:MAG: endonuclease III [Nitrospira sp.]|nr:MAG: endonuclease III [Nitrospira sp.]